MIYSDCPAELSVCNYERNVSSGTVKGWNSSEYNSVKSENTIERLTE